MITGPGIYELKGPMLPIGVKATVLEVKAYFAIGWINESAAIWSTHDGHNSYPGLPHLDIVKKFEPLATIRAIDQNYWDGRKS